MAFAVITLLLWLFKPEGANFSPDEQEQRKNRAKEQSSEWQWGLGSKRGVLMQRY